MQEGRADTRDLAGASALGFALLRFTHFSKRSFTSTVGYEFFFSAALAGAVLLVLAHAAVLLVKTILCDGALTSVYGAWKDMVPFDHSGKLAIATTLAALFVVIVTDQDAAARPVSSSSCISSLIGSATSADHASLNQTINIRCRSQVSRHHFQRVLAQQRRGLDRHRALRHPRRPAEQFDLAHRGVL